VSSVRGDEDDDNDSGVTDSDEDVEVLGTEQSVHHALAPTTSFRSMFTGGWGSGHPRPGHAERHGSAARLRTPTSMHRPRSSASRSRMGFGLGPAAPSFVHGKSATGGPMGGGRLPGTGDGHKAADPESRDVFGMIQWLESRLLLAGWDDSTPHALDTFVVSTSDVPAIEDMDGSPTGRMDRGNDGGASESGDRLTPLPRGLSIARPPRRRLGSMRRGTSSAMSATNTGGTVGSPTRRHAQGEHNHHASSRSMFRPGSSPANVLPRTWTRSDRRLSQATTHTSASRHGALATLQPPDTGTELSPAVLANSVEARLERARALAPPLEHVAPIVDDVLAIYQACMNEVGFSQRPSVVGTQLCLFTWHVPHTRSPPSRLPCDVFLCVCVVGVGVGGWALDRVPSAQRVRGAG